LFDTVEHVLITGTLRTRRDRTGVGADVRLGKAETTEPFAAGERL
jgi:hypothetical protein